MQFSKSRPYSTIQTFRRITTNTELILRSWAKLRRFVNYYARESSSVEPLILRLFIECKWVYWCFTSHATIFQLYMWRHRCAADWRRSCTSTVGLPTPSTFCRVLYSNVPVLHRYGMFSMMQRRIHVYNTTVNGWFSDNFNFCCIICLYFRISDFKIVPVYTSSSKYIFPYYDRETL